ncbi:MAG: hypothetical protein ABF679_06455 [Lentilactobacillus diolivorans]|jgi:hypothetical protein|uniref:hypothetical protein n=1 Tax=Lentilactobacillus diolivorans TaxID=179838 RepID=UPI000FF28D0E|nr:hypothetical protein [Lentilactobacillus diolivorans]RRG01007.1 MAG: hypothetical protein DUD34_13660 [Lactobacillus sp.]
MKALKHIFVASAFVFSVGAATYAGSSTAQAKGTTTFPSSLTNHTFYGAYYSKGHYGKYKYTLKNYATAYRFGKNSYKWGRYNSKTKKYTWNKAVKVKVTKTKQSSTTWYKATQTGTKKPAVTYFSPTGTNKIPGMIVKRGAHSSVPYGMFY